MTEDKPKQSFRVIVPYTNLRPETAAALDASGFTWEAIDVSKSDTSYWELLSGLWAEGKSFCTVEQDIEIVPKVTLQRFEFCPAVMCSSRYPYLHGMYSGLGCTRFRAEFIARIPTLMQEVGRMSNDLHPAKHFCTIDAWMQVTLRRHSIRPPHIHENVGHIRPGNPIPGVNTHMPSHGCVPFE